MYVWLETTFGTVQKWSLRPLLDSPKGGLSIEILLYFVLPITITLWHVSVLLPLFKTLEIQKNVEIFTRGDVGIITAYLCVCVYVCGKKKEPSKS